MVPILLLALVVAVGAAAGCTPEEQEEEGNYTDISAAEAKQLIDGDPEVVIIDVSPAYAAGMQRFQRWTRTPHIWSTVMPRARQDRERRNWWTLDLRMYTGWKVIMGPG
jgi:hypothetical protein